jgi:renalase
VLVAQATPEFARGGDAGKVATAVGELLGIQEQPRIEEFAWPYATPVSRPAGFARDGDVFLCGDAFGRPRVQTAWLSGRAAARAIIAGVHSTGPEKTGPKRESGQRTER